jgi:hypothetical protein
MSKRLLIVNPGHLANAPRVQKEAAAAIEVGFEVSIRGAWWDERLAAEDITLARSIGADFEPVIDFRSTKSGALLTRLKNRFSKELFLKFGVVTSRLYGYAGSELLMAARKIGADVTMGHSEVGMWVCHELLKQGACVGLDFDDWFSEDLPLADRAYRPVTMLRKLERSLLNNAPLTITTTTTMAEAMALDAGAIRIPLVIPNAFPAAQAPQQGKLTGDERDPAVLSLYWFSQTIGPSRGLEVLAEALRGVSGNWQLHLRGELRQNSDWFKSTFRGHISSRVILHASVSNADLPVLTASHDVGLALESPINPSRNLTATNKIFEYLRCGLAVLATATSGQQEIMEKCSDSGWVVPPDDVSSLRVAIQNCIDQPEVIRRAKDQAYKAGQTIWAWEPFGKRLGEALLQLDENFTPK